MIFAVTGMAGTGKTTACETLAVNHRLRHIVAGDVARRLAMSDPEVQDALDKGQLAPKHKMNAEMYKQIEDAATHGENVLLDGYPRYMEQMADLLLACFHHCVDFAFIVIECDDETAIARLAARARNDDMPEQIRNRLKHFHEETYPVIKWMRTRDSSIVLNVPNGTAQEQYETIRDFMLSILPEVI